MPKLLFFDIDGTLFDDQHRLPPSVLPAFRRAREYPAPQASRRSGIRRKLKAFRRGLEYPYLSRGRSDHLCSRATRPRSVFVFLQVRRV